MSLKRIVGTVAFGSVFAVALHVVGCGSSGGNGTGGSAGTGGSTGAGASAGSGGSKGTRGSKGSGGTGGSKGSGGTKGVTSDSGPQDGGGMCPASTSGFKPATYTPAVAHQGKCASTDISAFIAACGDSGSTTLCNTWKKANTGTSGTPCGNCILPGSTNNGGAWFDGTSRIVPNYGACTQLLDKTSGTACAMAYEAQWECVGVACDGCTTKTEFDNCFTTVANSGGGCRSFALTYDTACTADFAEGGALNTCEPTTTTGDADFTSIINLVCGGAG